MDAVKEDMQVVGVRVEDTEKRVKWKTLIRCGNAWKGESHKETKKISARQLVVNGQFSNLNSFAMNNKTWFNLIHFWIRL